MWMKIDDGLHAHRKTRAVTRSHPDKTRDAGPMGLWVLAGSWAGRNNRDGWVPIEELDRFDDEWEAHAARLVAAGFWWHEEVNGEDGYGFKDWDVWNNPDGASVSGSFGNHVRWHVNKGIVREDCDHCPKEPDSSADDRGDSHPTRPDDRGDHRPDVAPDIRSDIAPISLRDHRPESLTRTRPEPDPTRPEDNYLPATAVASEVDRFGEFWDTYGKKRDRKGAEAKWRLALKKPGVTADRLIDAAAAYVLYERTFNQGGRYVMDPARWLNGERWNDERPTVRAPQTRTQEHLALVQQLRADEQGGGLPQIGGGER